MTTPLRLVIFDVDGTLVDSQGEILHAMQAAFDVEGLAAPEPAAVRAIVGLTLDHAVARLAPQADAAAVTRVVAAYKETYAARRAALGAGAGSPLYPGARDLLAQLAGLPDLLLGVATGKSARGLDALLDAHGLEQYFVTRQVADHHPSKPHPSMIETALRETGTEARDAVMIGDTSFDMDMARNAGVAGLGVGWGYHPRPALSAAAAIVERFDDIPPALDRIWARQA